MTLNNQSGCISSLVRPGYQSLYSLKNNACSWVFSRRKKALSYLRVRHLPYYCKHCTKRYSRNLNNNNFIIPLFSMVQAMSHKAYRNYKSKFYWSGSIICWGRQGCLKARCYLERCTGYDWNTGCIHDMTQEHGCSWNTAWFYRDVKERATILKHTHVSQGFEQFMMNDLVRTFFFFRALFFPQTWHHFPSFQDISIRQAPEIWNRSLNPSEHFHRTDTEINIICG